MDTSHNGNQSEPLISTLEKFDWFTWLILPSIVLATRVPDIALGTMHIIFVSRDRKYLASILGFVEVLIWITVVSKIIGGTRNIVAYIAYALGFSVGNYVGIAIEEKLAIGTLPLVLSPTGSLPVVVVPSMRRSGIG